MTEQVSNTISELVPGSKGNLNFIPTHLHIFGFLPRHSSGRLSHLRGIRRWWRGGGVWLDMEYKWCGWGIWSWWQPFKVSVGMIFGAAAQLIPSRRLPTASTASRLRNAWSKYWRCLILLTNTITIQGFLLGGESYGCYVESQHRHTFFTQISLFFRRLNDEVVEKLNLTWTQVCPALTFSIWELAAYHCLLWLCFFVVSWLKAMIHQKSNPP